MARIMWRCAWELRRVGHAFLRRAGWAGVGLVVATIVALCAAGWERSQLKALQALQARALASPVLAPALPRRMLPDDDRARLAAFDFYVAAHEDIPTVLQDLLQAAEAQGLTIARGDYRAQADNVGRFVRYRMNMPVKGDSAAVRRFIAAGLQQNKSLALESIQIGRERIESREVQARIQWSLLARLPTHPVVVPAALQTAEAEVAR